MSPGWVVRLVAVLALACLMVGAGCAWAAARPKDIVPLAPVVLLKPTQRDGRVAPSHEGPALTGGGTINVLQPAPDTLAITMTGAAAAKANPCSASIACVEAVVDQQFEVVFPAGFRPAQLILEGHVVGLLRSEGKSGSAELAQATAVVHHGPEALIALNFPPKSVTGCEALAINLAEGPVCVPIGPGCHTLHLCLHITAAQGWSLCPHIASAEFAPPPALPPTWIHVPDPFGGVDRGGLGFQVTVRVEPGPQVLPAPLVKRDREK
jgi:hypothetical protein